MTGVNSILQRDLDAVAFQESSEEDDGSREIFFRGLALLSVVGASSCLNLRRTVAISEVACRLVPELMKSSDLFVQITTDWMQASFTTHNQRELIGGTVRTRRDLLRASVIPGSFQHSQVMSHLISSFPEIYTPNKLASRFRGGGPSVQGQLGTPSGSGPSTPATRGRVLEDKTLVTGTPQNTTAARSPRWSAAPPLVIVGCRANRSYQGEQYPRRTRKEVGGKCNR